MGLRLITDPSAVTDAVAMYDSVSGWAFGPVFHDEEEAGEFIAFLPQDPRAYTQPELAAWYERFVASRSEAS